MQNNLSIEVFDDADVPFDEQSGPSDICYSIDCDDAEIKRVQEILDGIGLNSCDLGTIEPHKAINVLREHGIEKDEIEIIILHVFAESISRNDLQDTDSWRLVASLQTGKKYLVDSATFAIHWAKAIGDMPDGREHDRIELQRILAKREDENPTSPKEVKKGFRDIFFKKIRGLLRS